MNKFYLIMAAISIFIIMGFYPITKIDAIDNMNIHVINQCAEQTNVISSEVIEYIDTVNHPFMMTLNKGISIEGESVGTYKVDGVDKGSSWTGSFILGQSLEAVSPPGNKWFFFKWSDGSAENPRSPTSDLKVHAIYKTHLASNGYFYPTAVFGQRRLVSFTGGGDTIGSCAVYESAGEIWSTLKWGKNDWEPEVCLSSGNGGNKNPSIDIYDNQFIMVTWEQTVGHDQTIYYRSGSINGKKIIWEPTQVVDVWHRTPGPRPTIIPYDTRPVVSRDHDAKVSVVVYDRKGTLTVMCNDGAGSWYAETAFAGYTPSLHNGNHGHFRLAYSSETTIYFRESMKHERDSRENEELIPASWGSINYSGDKDFGGSQSYYPQLYCNDAGCSHVCWREQQYSDLEYEYVVQQSRYNNGYGAATVYLVSSAGSKKEMGSPTICGTVNGNITMMWSVDNLIHRVTGDTDGKLPGLVQLVEGGKCPTLGLGAISPSPMYLSTISDSSLRGIASPEIIAQPNFSDKQSNRKLTYARVIFAIDPARGSVLSVRISEPTVGGKRVPLAAVNNKQPGINAKNFFDYLSTEITEIESTSDTLEFKLSMTSTRFEGISSIISLNIDGMQGKKKTGNLTSLKHNLEKEYVSISIRKPIKNLRGKNFRLKSSGSSLNFFGKNCIFGLAHVYF